MHALKIFLALSATSFLLTGALALVHADASTSALGRRDADAAPSRGWLLVANKADRTLSVIDSVNGRRRLSESITSW